MSRQRPGRRRCQRFCASAQPRTPTGRWPPSATARVAGCRSPTGEARAQADALGQALLDRGLGPDRPVLVLSGNSVEHLLVTLGGLHGGRAGGADQRRLLADERRPRADPGDRRRWSTRGWSSPTTRDRSPRRSTRSARSASAACPRDRPGARAPRRPARDRARRGVDARVARRRPRHGREAPVHVGLDRHAQGRRQHPSDARAPTRRCCARSGRSWPTSRRCCVDWLPWSHTFGGNHNLNLALSNGGTLYIDDGKPAPAAVRPDAARRFATSRRPSTSTCPPGSRCSHRSLERDPELARRVLLAGCGSCSTPAPRCPRRLRSRLRDARRAGGRPQVPLTLAGGRPRPRRRPPARTSPIAALGVHRRAAPGHRR